MARTRTRVAIANNYLADRNKTNVWGSQ
jgi:hypothetical protein